MSFLMDVICLGVGAWCFYNAFEFIKAGKNAWGYVQILLGLLNIWVAFL